jgi:hypothetical protein
MPLHTAKYWRDRAAEARAEMKRMSDADARKMMQAVVDQCEELAATIERLAATGVLPPEK